MPGCPPNDSCASSSFMRCASPIRRPDMEAFPVIAPGVMSACDHSSARGREGEDSSATPSRKPRFDRVARPSNLPVSGDEDSETDTREFPPASSASGCWTPASAAMLSPRQIALRETEAGRSSVGHEPRPVMLERTSCSPAASTRSTRPSMNSSEPSGSDGMRDASGCAGLSSTTARAASMARSIRPPRGGVGNGMAPSWSEPRRTGRKSATLVKEISPPSAAIGESSITMRSDRSTGGASGIPHSRSDTSASSAWKDGQT